MTFLIAITKHKPRLQIIETYFVSVCHQLKQKIKLTAVKLDEIKLASVFDKWKILLICDSLPYLFQVERAAYVYERMTIKEHAGVQL